MPRASRFVLPLTVCLCLLAAATPAFAQVTLPSGGTLDNVDFERHVMGVFGRSGCNMGSCHGSFQGKGGFRLSLFGYDPEKDYWAVTHDSLGRRVNRTDPDSSLLLLKATGQMEHGGGVRFSKNTWQYEVLRQWIAKGTPWTKGSGDVAGVTVTPPQLAFAKPDDSRPLVVKAKFSDGSEADITAFTDFRTNDDAIAEVSSSGAVRSLKPGSTAIVVSYRGNVLAVPVLVPMQLKPGFQYPNVPAASYIDTEVFARLKLLNMVPSDQSSDEEFLRRVTIDTIGQLPTPEDIKIFLADKSPDKRAKKIDQLLEHPLHAALWATKFCDITGNDTLSLEQPVQLRSKRSQLWHDWFRKRVAENMPYDQIVHGVLCASSREGKTPEDWIARVKVIDSQSRRVSIPNSTTPSAKRSTFIGGGNRSSRSSSGASGPPPPSWASASSAPSATSIRSTVGRRSITVPTPTSSRRSRSASRPRRRA